jgi:hypothetical protein
METAPTGRRGIALIAVILIILVVAIAVLGIAASISNAMHLSVVKASLETALFAAQAGIYAGVHDYLATAGQLYWTKARNIEIARNIYYSVGTDANFLAVDATTAERQNDMIRRVGIANINETQSITVNQMTVEWYNFTGDDANAVLTQIRLGGSQRWSGTAVSGQRVALESSFLISRRQSFSGTNDNLLRFDRNVPASGIVVVTFFFTDGSSRKAYLLNESGMPGRNEFSITATGEVRGAANWRRTIEATYDVTANRITSWQEAAGHV